MITRFSFKIWMNWSWRRLSCYSEPWTFYSVQRAAKLRAQNKPQNYSGGRFKAFGGASAARKKPIPLYPITKVAKPCRYQKNLKNRYLNQRITIELILHHKIYVFYSRYLLDHDAYRNLSQQLSEVRESSFESSCQRYFETRVLQGKGRMKALGFILISPHTNFNHWNSVYFIVLNTSYFTIYCKNRSIANTHTQEQLT